MASIQNKIFFPVVAIILGIGSATAALTYDFVRSSIGDLTSHEARKLADSVTKTIEADQLLRVREAVLSADGDKTLLKEVTNLEDYNAIRIKLAEIKQFHGLRFLYTATLNQKGQIVYLVDSYDSNTPADDISWPGDIETNQYPDLIRSFKTGKSYSGEFTVNDRWGSLISAYSPVRNSRGEVIAVVGADIDASAPAHGLQTFKIMSVATLLVLTGSILIAVFFILRKVLQPLRKLTDAAHLIEQGDLRVELKIETSDETALLGSAFSRMTETLRSFISDTAATAANSRSLAESLLSETESIQKGGSRISKITEDVTRESTETSNKTKDAARVFEEISTGITEVSASVQNIASVADSTLHSTETGRTKIEQAIAQMNSISSSVQNSVQLIEQLHGRSGEIESMVAVISDISGRTNLLALNASIEAARAGEQGRGFAVVADEINKLAEQSSLSANQIATLVKEIQEQTEKNVRSMENVKGEVTSGITLIHESGSMFSHIGSGSRELNDGLVTLGGSSEEMSASIVEVASVVENLNKSMQSIRVEFMSVDESLAAQNDSIVRIKEMTVRLVAIAQQIEDQLKRFKT